MLLCTLRVSSRRLSSIEMSASEDISKTLTDAFARRADEAGLLRPEALRLQESGELWTGPAPAPDLSAQDVISITLTALRNNNEPKTHSGTGEFRFRTRATFCCSA